MRATVRDRALFQTLSPQDVVAYLRHRGWTRETGNQDNSAWFAYAGPSESFEVLVPLTEGLVDYATRLSQLVGTLERAENRSQLDIIRDIGLTGVDVIRVQAPEADSRRGSIRLDTGSGLIDRTSEMMLAAAASAIAPRRVVPARRPNEAAEYIRRIELGQSERGSYVITVLSPLESISKSTPPLLEVMDAPFSRQVTRTLASALGAAKLATASVIEGGTVATFGEAVRKGVSANLCEALAGMLESASQVASLSVRIDWAPKLYEASGPVQVNFSSDEATILIAAAQFLREQAPESGILITGVVTKLHREENQTMGIATVACVINGRVRKLYVPLGVEDYDAAIQAHRTQRPVLFSADIVRVGRQYQAESVYHFRLGE